MSTSAFIAVRCPEEVKSDLESKAKDRGQSLTGFILSALGESIPTVPLTERHLLPECPGGFIVLAGDGTMLAMGHTTNLRNHWSQPEHLGKYLAFDSRARVGWVLAHPMFVQEEEPTVGIADSIPAAKVKGLIQELLLKIDER